MITAKILRVFIDPKGRFGDRASIVVDEGKKINDEKRQNIARQLGTGETIFINNLQKAAISVMHPQGEISFAGVGILAKAWYLSKVTGKQINGLSGRDGEILVQQKEKVVWVQTKVDTLPPWNIIEKKSWSEIELLQVNEMKSVEHTIYWAWINRDRGLIRARTFANDWEIPEAEGNGSGAMLLAHHLKRRIQIKHGKGSIIFANYLDNENLELGGRVIEESLSKALV